jgi:hypothetical protein
MPDLGFLADQSYDIQKQDANRGMKLEDFSTPNLRSCNVD